MIIRFLDEIYVNVIDFGPLEAKALEQIKPAAPQVDKLCIRLPHGVITTTQGIYILDINGEGCDDPIIANKMAEIALYGVYMAGGEQQITKKPLVSVSVTLDMLFSFLPVKERVKLAAFIKDGTEMLDMRYLKWHRKVKDIYVDTSPKTIQ